MESSVPALAQAGFEHGFGGTAEGDRRAGPLPLGVALAHQVHGTQVIAVTAAGRLAEEADALTAASGLGAGVLTADCVPVLLAHPASGRAAAVHAGWRGTLANTVGAALKSLQARGVAPGDVLVGLGPCIRSCCYEVSPELLATFVAALGHGVCSASGRLDLVAANLEQLARAGIPRAQVFDVGECTCCSRERYFSHRRDGARAGRQLSWIRSREGRA